jgi:hypothetical protein
MEVYDYNDLRDRLTESLLEADLRISVDEVVYLSGLTRECEILVYPRSVGPDVWGKVAFEWTAGNQSLLDVLDQDQEFASELLDDLDLASAQVLMHCEFHLHFGHLVVSTDVVRDVASHIKDQAEQYFGGEGGVVAEVHLTSEEAKLDCLRYEVNTMTSLITDEEWWERWGYLCRDMLSHLSAIHTHLESMFGPQRN